MPWYGDTHFQVDPDFYDDPAPIVDETEPSPHAAVSSPPTYDELLQQLEEEKKRYASLAKLLAKVSLDRKRFETMWKKEKESFDAFLDLTDEANAAKEKSFRTRQRLMILASSVITSGLITNYMAPEHFSWQIPVLALIGAVPAYVLCSAYASLFLTDKMEMPRAVDYLIILAVTGTISGILIGLCGGMLINRIKFKFLSKRS